MASGSLTCPNCQMVLQTARAMPPGARMKCPKCQTVFATPGAPEPPAAAPEPPPLPTPQPPNPYAASPDPVSTAPAAAAPSADPYAIPPAAEGPITGSPPPRPLPGGFDAPRRRGPAADPDYPPPARRGVPMWVWLVVAAGVCLLLGFCICVGVAASLWYTVPTRPPGGPAVTQTNFAGVQYNMSEAEVEELLGPPKAKLKPSDFPLDGPKPPPAGSQKLYRWEDGEDFLEILFVKGKVWGRRLREGGRLRTYEGS
jgi:hypothetical protein